jgi:hypothetical protein
MVPTQFVAVSASLVGLSIADVSLRFFTRIHLVKWVGPDDILILFGTVAAVVEAAASFAGMNR